MRNIEVTTDQQGVALLALNRPEVLNVLNAPLLEELCQALRELATDEKVRALGACLLGDSLKAAQLQEWGLVWECVDADQLLPRALQLGARLADVPAETVLATRQMVDSASENSFSAVLKQERLAQRQLCDLPVFSESVARFLSK